MLWEAQIYLLEENWDPPWESQPWGGKNCLEFCLVVASCYHSPPIQPSSHWESVLCKSIGSAKQWKLWYKRARLRWICNSMLYNANIHIFWMIESEWTIFLNFYGSLSCWHPIPVYQIPCSASLVSMGHKSRYDRKILRKLDLAKIQHLQCLNPAFLQTLSSRNLRRYMQRTEKHILLHEVWAPTSISVPIFQWVKRDNAQGCLG